MKLITNKLFSLSDLDKVILESFFINKECCLFIVNEKASEVDQFYLEYTNDIVKDIQSILTENGYEQNQFYLLKSNQFSI